MGAGGSDLVFPVVVVGGAKLVLEDVGAWGAAVGAEGAVLWLSVEAGGAKGSMVVVVGARWSVMVLGMEVPVATKVSSIVSKVPGKVAPREVCTWRG